MKYTTVLLIIITLFSFEGIAQTKLLESKPTSLYSDYVADENGKRLRNITVKVRGRNISTKTNVNGEFTIRAEIGDEILLSKDGVVISSYIYDGSAQYRVENRSNTRIIENDDSEVVEFQIQLDSAAYFLKSNPLKSVSYVEKSLKELVNHKIEDPEKTSKAYEILGDAYSNLNQFDLAISNYEIALSNDSSPEILLKLAQAYSGFKNYTKSNELLNDLKVKRLPKALRINYYSLFGQNYEQLGVIDTAIENYKDALALADKHDNSTKSVELNSRLGSLYLIQNDTATANRLFNSSILESKNEGFVKQAIISNAVADQYGEHEDYDREIALKEKTLFDLKQEDLNEVVAEDAGEGLSVQQLNLDIGKAYLKKNAVSKAVDYLEQSKVEAERFSDIETKKEAVQQLSEIYKNVGDFDKALNNYQEYVKLVDLLYKKKEQEINDAAALNRNLIAQQNRISSLEKDRALLESQYKLYESQEQVSSESYKRQQIVIYSLLIGLILLATAVYFMYRNNRQKRLSNNLLALKSLRSQMNPHFIFNALNSVNSFIAQNDERTANRYLTNFSKLMRNVLDNSEKDFIPLENEIELLKLYLQLEHARFEDKFDYEIRIDEQVKINEYQIPPMLIQPYVENAVWHGLRYRKSKGVLTILFSEVKEGVVLIEIVDNGIGRAKSKEIKTAHQKKKGSKGMNNIQQRVEILNEMYNDKLSVQIDDLNADGSGTKVLLTLKRD